MPSNKICLSRGKDCIIHLEKSIMLKSYLKQNNVEPHPHTTLSCLN